MWKLLIDKNDVDDFYLKSTSEHKEELKNLEVTYTKVSDVAYVSKLPANLVFYGNEDTYEIFSKGYILDQIANDQIPKDLIELREEDCCLFVKVGITNGEVIARYKNYPLRVDNIESV